jgi:peptide/nickel transport system permease protein
MTRVAAAGASLAVVYGVVSFANFLAPYDPALQHRDRPFAPPTAMHFVDADGHLHARPFVYDAAASGESEESYVEDRSRPYPVRFFVRTGSALHLFGVDAPAGIFLAGTDQFGRDQFSRILHGGRVSLAAGVLAAALSLSLGMILGALAGSGRWPDAVVMRASDVFLAIPWIYLLLAARAALPLNVDPLRALAAVVVVIGIAGWARPARLVRSVVLSAKTRDFVAAARASGGSRWYLLRAHILPQTFGVVLTQASILVPQFALAEITLSFFGLGVAEPIPSWGTLIRGMLRQQAASLTWWMAAPALALAVVFLLHHAFTDALHGAALGPAMDGVS